MNEISIGLLGIGTVGGGVLKIYGQNRAGLEAKAGCRVKIAAVADRDVTTPRPGSRSATGRSRPTWTGCSAIPGWRS